MAKSTPNPKTANNPRILYLANFKNKLYISRHKINTYSYKLCMAHWLVQYICMAHWLVQWICWSSNHKLFCISLVIVVIVANCMAKADPRFIEQ